MQSRTAPTQAFLVLLAAALVLGLVAVPSPAAAADGPADYVSMPPERVLDTRDGQGDIDTPIGHRATEAQQVAGVGNVPADAEAVAVNVTAINPSAQSYLRIFPAGAAMPDAASLNFPAGRTVGNFLITELGDDGEVEIYNHNGEVDVTFDVMGYFPAGADYEGMSPERVLDTRDDVAVGHRDTIDVPVAGQAGVPGDAEAVAINVTAIAPTAQSYLRVFPAGQTMPEAASLNFQAGQVVGNLVVAEVGDGGEVSLYNHNGEVDVTFDVVGYFPAGGEFEQVEPARLLDTRNDSQGEHDEPIGHRSQITQTVTGEHGVPEDARAVAVNLTVVDPSNLSHLRVYPTGAERPNAATVNFPAGLNVNNMVIADVGDDGQITIYNRNGSVDLTIDVVGYLPGS